ncbi:DUF5050 domain-containing protein [Paenibacillus pedocola]|uniref:DUF5050 domain-containing protein n=1 Tax=Paenibacillus pedocola TaxID=3242193 RepID=UPI002877B52F|nr:DUF5050 domain-containing protein [Paenibacillus typhae]
MNDYQRYAKKFSLMLLVSVLTIIGIAGGGLNTLPASAASSNAYVYYISDNDLYRVPSNGGSAQLITENFESAYSLSTNKYLYFMMDENSTSLQRLSLTEPSALITSFGGDKEILNYTINDNYIYFMDTTGSIYRSPADAADESQIKRIIDNGDANFPSFSIVKGRVYYNALKSNSTTWVASKAKDGSGNILWIASGAVYGARHIQENNTTLSLMVNTDPSETEYSLNCMVLYSLPFNGGAPKAANAKAPLDTNEVFSGKLTSNYYLYNKGIKLDANGEYNYSTGKGYLIDKNGKIFQLSQSSVVEISEISSNKLAYVDAKGKAYVSTVANGKVTSTKMLPISNATAVRTLMYGAAAGSTIFFNKTDAYVLNADLSLTKAAGVVWEYMAYALNIPGLFYINELDNDSLYRLSNDGKTKLRLSADPVSQIITITAI